MKPIDEWTDSELTEMTDEQYQQLVASELMEAGILKPVPANEVEVPEVLAPSSTFYQVKMTSGYREESFLVETIEDAGKAVELLQSLKAYREDYADNDYTVKIPRLIDSITSTAIKCYTAAEYESVKGIKAKADKAKEHNDEEERRYKREQETAQAIHDDINSRVSSARSRIAVHNRIFATWDEYLQTCDGESSTAMKFLLKVYPRDQIAAAQNFDVGRITGRLPAAEQSPVEAPQEVEA